MGLPWQWLRLHASNAGGVGLISGQGVRSHVLHSMAKRLKKEKTPLQIQRSLNKVNLTKFTPRHITAKLKTKEKRISKTAKEKCYLTYKGIGDSSSETMRPEGSGTLQIVKENYRQLRILYQVKNTLQNVEGT